jgi:hypothetical protein
MKKFVTGLIIGAVLMLSIGSFAESLFQFKGSANTLYVDGRRVDMPMFNYQNTNYASIRGIATALGLDIKVTGTRIDFTSKTEEQNVVPTPTPSPEPQASDPYATIKSKLMVVRLDGTDYIEFGDLITELYAYNYEMGSSLNGTFYLAYRDEQRKQIRVAEGIPCKIDSGNYYFALSVCEERIFPYLINN